MDSQVLGRCTAQRLEVLNSKIITMNYSKSTSRQPVTEAVK